LIGKPGGVSTNPSGIPAIEISVGQNLTIIATSTPGSDIYSLNWSKVGAGINILAGQGNCTVEGTSISTNYVYVSASNNSGTGWSKQIPVNVTIGGGQQLSVMSPNPANTEVTLNLISVFANDKVEKADVFLYNDGNKVVFQTVLKYNSLAIPTNNLVEGLYHLKVYYLDKVFQRHLRIKH
jgi:hypothetical protein